MKIVLTGGGTGGHITPILAVANELKRAVPDVRIIYVGERGGKFAKMTEGNSDIDQIHTIFAGKFRRYHRESWFKRLTDVETSLLNARDFFYFIIGTFQSLRLMRRLRPDAVLLKGGFVGVPVGLACAAMKLPFITHDSDALPGLANRIVARWARFHTTALPAEFYSYPRDSVRQVGVLMSREYTPVSAARQADFRKRIGIPVRSRLLLVTGGSGGAASINRAVREIIADLLGENDDLYVVHQTGKGKKDLYDDFAHERLRVEELLFPLYEYTGASDLVITRAGANTLAELGAQGKACIVVPNPHLTGGHQIINAKYYRDRGAIFLLEDATIRKDALKLKAVIDDLLKDSSQRKVLGERIRELTLPGAAGKLAALLIGIANNNTETDL